MSFKHDNIEEWYKRIDDFIDLVKSVGKNVDLLIQKTSDSLDKVT